MSLHVGIMLDNIKLIQDRREIITDILYNITPKSTSITPPIQNEKQTILKEADDIITEAKKLQKPYYTHRYEWKKLDKLITNVNKFKKDINTLSDDDIKETIEEFKDILNQVGSTKYGGGRSLKIKYIYRKRY
ncbi:preprotein translocase subunit secA [Fadolivirus algeromassiliense]|jgi:hypothetical protein|uniref:Preprotein translocase subunit secA n=1 Tax=Fadolivirus FV1/VV64 TaxID=3070911 RepID=A0A7D3R0H5_9VIRU|nr:preprotein translocase subunit secA [Fadolivirus algeromassiliense]QKF93661.1 preprotein translocase subunit secA [Fadolivirus FV1/VV64]